MRRTGVSALDHMRTLEKTDICKPRNRLLTDTGMAGLDLALSRLLICEEKFLWSKPPSLGKFVMAT